MENNSEILMFTVTGSIPIIGKIINQNDYDVVVDYPLMLIKEDNNHLHTVPYMPLAKNNVVAFNRSSIISHCQIDTKIILYYEEMVKLYKDQTAKVEYEVAEKKYEPFLRYTASKAIH